MRVAFNAQFLEDPYTGTGRYVRNLLTALGRVDGVNEYLVVTPHELATPLESPSSFRWEVACPPAKGHGGRHLEKVLWEQRTFPQAARRATAQVMHVPYFAPPMQTYGVPCIVTIHDVIALRLPAYRASARAQAYAHFVARAARRATAIIAVSAFTKQDIIELLDIPAARIVVIGEAPDPRYRRVMDPLRLHAVRAKYGLGERFVLNVGGLDARKNVKTLVGAFAAAYHELGDPELDLFIAGDQDRLGSSPVFPDWRSLVPLFGISGHVLCMPVDEEDLPALYSAASCFVSTSLYEGFGLPPLEAMACGTPVICSNRTALPEVVGSAGLLVNPEDPDQVGAQLLRVLSDSARRDDLSARGQAHVRQFSWDRAAAQTSGLYAEVTGTGRD